MKTLLNLSFFTGLEERALLGCMSNGDCLIKWLEGLMEGTVVRADTADTLSPLRPVCPPLVEYILAASDAVLASAVFRDIVRHLGYLKPTISLCPGPILPMVSGSVKKGIGISVIPCCRVVAMFQAIYLFGSFCSSARSSRPSGTSRRPRRR